MISRTVLPAEVRDAIEELHASVAQSVSAAAADAFPAYFFDEVARALKVRPGLSGAPMRAFCRATVLSYIASELKRVHGLP